MFRQTIPLRYSADPIIPQPEGSWYETNEADLNAYIDPRDSSKLRMFATGVAADFTTAKIGWFSANVSDPYTWTDEGVILEAGGGWESGGILRVQSVVHLSGTDYLYYNCDTTDPSYASSIGVATSTDGAVWSKYGGNPILTPTGQGRNDGTAVSQPNVVKHGSDWTMFYSYRDGITILPGYRYATSSDGLAWSKGGSGDVLTMAPLYAEGSQSLKIAENDYYLIFSSGNFSTSWKVFLARSPSLHGPYDQVEELLLPSGAVGKFDRYHVSTPWLIDVSGQWILYYQGAGTTDQPYTSNMWACGAAILQPRFVSTSRAA